MATQTPVATTFNNTQQQHVATSIIKPQNAVTQQHVPTTIKANNTTIIKPKQQQVATTI